MRPEAAALYERLFGSKDRNAALAERVPPGQYVTEKFPVLHYGSVPKFDLATWDFKVYGEVDSPFTLTWAQLKELPRKQVTTDIHCVTRWSKLDTAWEGVPIQHVLELAQVRSNASHVVAHSEQGYTANLPLDVLDDDDVLLADTYDGQPLEPEHGYPLRLFAPPPCHRSPPSGEKLIGSLCNPPTLRSRSFPKGQRYCSRGPGR